MELIMLVAVLAILVAVAIPGMSPVILHYRLRGAAWQLAGDLRLARQRAVTLQVRFRVCVTNCAIGVPPGSYSVERDAGPPGAPSWVNETGVATQMPEGVQVTATATPVFIANGMAQSTGTFALTNPLGSITVQVVPTGQVQVCEGVSCS